MTNSHFYYSDNCHSPFSLFIFFLDYTSLALELFPFLDYTSIYQFIHFPLPISLYLDIYPISIYQFPFTSLSFSESVTPGKNFHWYFFHGTHFAKWP